MGQGEYSGQKRKLPGESSEKTYPKRRRVERDNTSTYCKRDQDTCCVCFGLYKDTSIAKLDLCWLTMTGFSAMKKTVVSGAMSSV